VTPADTAWIIRGTAFPHRTAQQTRHRAVRGIGGQDGSRCRVGCRDCQPCRKSLKTAGRRHRWGSCPQASSTTLSNMAGVRTV
jgi:hypothetical protein